jgi:hypothetical protein
MMNGSKKMGTQEVSSLNKTEHLLIVLMAILELERKRIGMRIHYTGMPLMI